MSNSKLISNALHLKQKGSDMVLSAKTVDADGTTDTFQIAKFEGTGAGMAALKLVKDGFLQDDQSRFDSFALNVSVHAAIILGQKGVLTLDEVSNHIKSNGKQPEALKLIMEQLSDSKEAREIRKTMSDIIETLGAMASNEKSKAKDVAEMGDDPFAEREAAKERLASKKAKRKADKT
jgi:Cft2 family RNA processing exonuclease